MLVGPPVLVGPQTGAGMASGNRAAPFYCPYCGDEDLVPLPAPEGAGSGHGQWSCRSCRRGFRLSLVALVAATSPADTAPAGEQNTRTERGEPMACGEPKARYNKETS